MKRNRAFPSDILDISREPIHEAREDRDLDMLTDLELMLAAGGEQVVCWDPPK